MSSQIEEVVGKCDVCASYHSANSREPMIASESPNRSWGRLGCHLFEFRGSHYLFCVDYNLKSPKKARLERLISRTTVIHLRRLFARYGIPGGKPENGPSGPNSDKYFEETPRPISEIGFQKYPFGENWVLAVTTVHESTF